MTLGVYMLSCMSEALLGNPTNVHSTSLNGNLYVSVVIILVIMA
jgi:hypothetical protein